MNLTWELRRGHVGRWVRQTLPDVGLLEPMWHSATSSAVTRRPRHAGAGGPDWPTLGTAIHHRIDFGFAADPPTGAFRGVALLDPATSVDGLVTAFRQGWCSHDAIAATPAGPLSFASRLGQFVARYDLTSSQPAAVERTLARALWVLARWESAYRGDDPSGWWQGPASATWTAGDWLAVAPDYAVADVAAVADLFTSRGRENLIAAVGPGQVAVAQVYVADWADADLVVGSCVVDIKGTVHPQRFNPAWIFQLCCYAWLDGHVDTIAVYLARQGQTVALDLAATVETISGGRDPWVVADEARDVMREAAAASGRRVP